MRHCCCYYREDYDIPLPLPDGVHLAADPNSHRQGWLERYMRISEMTCHHYRGSKKILPFAFLSRLEKLCPGREADNCQDEAEMARKMTEMFDLRCPEA